VEWTNGLTGRIVERGSPGYEEARRNFNSRFSRYPRLIVFCGNADDASNAVLWARKNKMPFRIRNGRHSYEAFSLLDGGLVIDTSGILELQIDKSAGTAKVGAGFRLKPLYEALWREGVTIPAGTCPTVGISGLTLGGGYGFLSRLYGMTCDNVLELEMVDYQGSLLLANDKTRSDLFRACLGGGDGSYGIITSFTFSVHPIGDVSHYSMTWDFADLKQVVRYWQSWAPQSDSRLTSSLNLPASGQGSIISSGIYVGLEKELRRTVRPFLEAVPPKKSTFRSASWMEAVRMLAGREVKQSTFKNSSAFAYEPFTEQAISELVKNLSTAPGPSNMVAFDAYGGAIAEMPADKTAFVHRKALFMMQYQTYWEEEQDAVPNIEWVERFRSSMLPYTRGAYRNYCDSLIEDWPDSYFGEYYARLQRVKQIYDPDNLFHYEQSIR
jgi:FAD/FMN-containing dehydrogenase